MRFDENLYVKMTLTGASVTSDVLDLESFISRLRPCLGGQAPPFL